MSEDTVQKILGLHGDKVFLEEPNFDDIEHHGVKGMRWGVRRATRQGQALANSKKAHDNAALKGGVTSGLHKNRAKAAEKSLNKINKRIEKKGGTPVPVPGRRTAGGSKKGDNRTHFQKPGRRLSDKELQDRIKRMELEKRYNDLNARQISSGRKFTNDVLGNTGKTVATTLLTGAAVYAAAHAINKKFGPDAASGITKVSFPKAKAAAPVVREIAQNTRSFT